MFSFPVEVVVRTPEGIDLIKVHVAIDEIALIKPLDKSYGFGIECDPSYSLLPNSEIVFVDGRKLPVLDHAESLNRYLDAYRSLEEFYTQPKGSTKQGNIIPLFGKSSCDTSEGSTPA